MKTFRIQRFQPGHNLYTVASIMHDGKFYQSVFGQCVDENGKFMHFTLERFDTLIEEGVYDYDQYFSSANKCVVLRLIKFNDVDISARELEHHPACYAYNLKGCCAHGLEIDLSAPMLLHSKDAFKQFMSKVTEPIGQIIYEKFKQ